jgi:hypothetical protein
MKIPLFVEKQLVKLVLKKYGPLLAKGVEEETI